MSWSSSYVIHISCLFQTSFRYGPVHTSIIQSSLACIMFACTPHTVFFPHNEQFCLSFHVEMKCLYKLKFCESFSRSEVLILKDSALYNSNKAALQMELPSTYNQSSAWNEVVWSGDTVCSHDWLSFESRIFAYFFFYSGPILSAWLSI